MFFQAYDLNSIRNMQFRESALSLFDDNQLTAPQYEAIENAFPVSFKQPNVFMRIGLFIFTLFCVLSTSGLFALVFLDVIKSETSIGFFLFFYALILFSAAEFFIQNNHWYRSGSDNALIYAGIGFLISALVLITNIKIEANSFFLTLVLILGLATWRYGDPILSLATFIALLVWAFMFCKEAGMSLALIPLSLATLSLTTYFFSKSQKNETEAIYWAECFQVLEIAGLIAFYASINYFVLHYFAIELDNRFLTEPLPMDIVFAFLTALVPIAYIFWGIKKHDRTLWIIGGLCIILSVLTYRYYHSILPIEWGITLAGLFFFLLGLFLINYFKSPRNGFAYQPEQGKNNPLEALIMNQLLQPTHDTGTMQDSPPQYGGGDFDGGGAGGEF